MNNLITQALNFASVAHADQRRKFSDVPYIVHPMRVYMLVSTRYPNFIELQQAALLHDTMEDCGTTKYELVRQFGPVVADLVVELTNVYTKEDYPEYNRAQRKAMEFGRISGISPRAKLVKLADRIDNLRDMPGTGDFMHTYLDESFHLAAVLEGTDPILEKELDICIKEGYDAVMQNKLKGIGQ